MDAKKKENDKKILFLGEFSDKELEKEYLNERIRYTLNYINPLILLLGVLYFLFIIPDYFFVKNPDSFIVILLDRIIFFILIVIFYYYTKNIKKYRTIIDWITAYEIIVSILFLIVLYNYGTPHFLVQAFGVNVLLISIFMIPNRWLYKIIVSLFISVAFFSLSFYGVKNIMMSEYCSAVSYTIIIIILSSISSYRVNYLLRMQHVSNKNFQKLAITDSLTGLYNRLKFDEELDKWVKYSKRSNTDLSLVILDFDNFKQINDNYGHLVGDNVIVDAVKLVQEIIRETDVFARWGGEEFVILLPNTDKQNAIILSERLRVVIGNNTFDSVGSLTCSFGVATLNSEDDVQSFLHRADLLLYEAKQSGKNIVKS